MELVIVVILIMSVSLSNQAMKIDRDVKDTTHGYGQCGGFGRTTGGWFSCTCRDAYTTMMSKGDTDDYDCKTPEEIGCDYTLTENNQTYLVTESNVNQILVPTVPGNEKIIVTRIRLWTYNLYHGDWIDITGEASNQFTVTQGKTTNVTIPNLDLDMWKGHLVKLILNYNKCLVVKIKGTHDYPFDLKKFRTLLRKPATTMGATTMEVTTAAKTGASTKTTRTTRLSTRKVTTPVATTVITEGKTETTKGTSPRTSWTRQTTIARTTAATMPEHHDNSIAIGVGVGVGVIAILVGLAILFVYHRRKSKGKTYTDDVDEKKVPHRSSPDISMVNNAYEPTEFNNGAIKNNDSKSKDSSEKTFTAFSNDANQEDKGNEYVDTNTFHDTPKTGSVNPVYMCYVESDDNNKTEQ